MWLRARVRGRHRVKSSVRCSVRIGFNGSVCVQFRAWLRCCMGVGED